MNGITDARRLFHSHLKETKKKQKSTIYSSMDSYTLFNLFGETMGIFRWYSFVHNLQN